MSVFDPDLPYAIRGNNGDPPAEDFQITELAGVILVHDVTGRELVMVGAKFGDFILFFRIRPDKQPRFWPAKVTDSSQGKIIEIQGRKGGFEIAMDDTLTTAEVSRIASASAADDEWTGTRTG